jgi:hypothetical protein
MWSGIGLGSGWPVLFNLHPTFIMNIDLAHC